MMDTSKIRVVCWKCGEKLDFEISKGKKFIISVMLCLNCLDRESTVAYDDGHETGYGHGYNHGAP